MANAPDAREFQSRLQRLEGLIRQAERVADPSTRAQTRAVVQAVLDLHALGLERVLAHLGAAGEAGRALRDAIAADPVAGGLLLLHELHPLGLEDRARQAIDQAMPRLRPLGVRATLLGVTDGVVRVRLDGATTGDPSAIGTVRDVLDEALAARAPDAAGVEVDDETADRSALEGGRPRLALPVVEHRP